jgi:hypothetical protein
MIFGYLMLASAITISAIAAWYSIAGLTAIFAAAVVPVIIMGGSLELGKIVATVWLHNNWKRAGWLYKTYLVPAIVFLMLLTSMGIFGFLSKAHSDQSLVSGDAMSKIAIYDEKITAERDNIAAAKKALEQMNSQVDQMMGRTDSDKGAERSVSIRRSQAKERNALQADITKSQKNIQSLQQERAPLAAEFRKVEAEVGPIKYIAAFIYGDDPDQNVLEKAVRWVIILIVIVFDPLALCLILAANKQLEWARHGTGGWVHEDEQPIIPRVTEAIITPPRAPEPPEVTEEEEAAFKALEPKEEVKVVEPEIPVLENEEMWSQRVIDEANEKIAELEPATDPVVEVIEEAPPVANAPVLTEEQQQFLDLAPALIEELNADLSEKTRELAELQDDYNQLAELKSGGLENSYGLRKQIDALQAQVAEIEAARNVEHQRANNLTQQLMDLMHPRDAAPEVDLTPVADNAPLIVELKEGPSSSFGSTFPTDPNRGDLFLRTDYLPTKLFKYNGADWFELDKANTDTYAYNDQYIEYLIEKLKTGEYDTDDITDAEHEQIAQYLQGRNANN